MTKEQFRSLFNQASNEVAAEFYPKDEYVHTGRPGIDFDADGEPVKTERSARRGEYLRDQAVLYVKLEQLLWDGMLLEET